MRTASKCKQARHLKRMHRFSNLSVSIFLYILRLARLARTRDKSRSQKFQKEERASLTLFKRDSINNHWQSDSIRKNTRICCMNLWHCRKQRLLYCFNAFNSRKPNVPMKSNQMISNHQVDLFHRETKNSRRESKIVFQPGSQCGDISDKFLEV